MAQRKITIREYDKRVDQILEKMKSKATEFVDDSDIAKKERKDRAKVDRLWFAANYLPHYCYKPFGDFHRQLNAFLDVKDEMCFLAGPRESGKTTIDGLVVQLHDICFGLKHFEMLVSETDTQASDFARFIKLEIEENDRIKQDFGDLKGRYRWQDDDFVTANNIRVLSRGRGQAVKSMRWRQYRPDRIVIIDFENWKNVFNPKLIKRGVSWIRGELRGCLAEGGSMLMEGQIIRKNCILDTFVREKDEKGRSKYRSAVWPAIFADGSSFWPEGRSKASLKRLKKDMGTVEFNRWMQNNPVDEDGLFREEWVTYYKEKELLGRALRTFQYTDPSVGRGQTHNFKATLVVSFDENGICYIRDAWIRKASVNMMIMHGYNVYSTLKPELWEYEDNSSQKFLDTDFQQYAKDHGYNYFPRGFSNSENKVVRISRLSRPIELGLIRFLKGQGDQGLLIEQLLFYDEGRAVEDDGPDALTGVYRLGQRVADLIVLI